MAPRFARLLLAVALTAAPVLAGALSACGPTTPKVVEPFSTLSAECQSERNAGAQPVGKESDISGSNHLLLDQPNANGNRKVNQKATSVLGATQYVSIDYSTRVFVECLLPSTGYAYVRVVQPDYLTEHRGWVPASVLTASLTEDSRQGSSGNRNDYIVTMDTQNTYDEKRVEFVETSPAVCGSGATPGVRGAGTLKVFNLPEAITVQVIPCSITDETMVKLPDGRVLYLRKSI